MVAGGTGHRPVTRPQGEERLAECPPDAGRRDTCAAASACRERHRPYSVCLIMDRYRQRADDAKHRASQARDPSIKSAFEHVAAGWVALAEQVERIDRENDQQGV
jgi:hypothetical protein